MDYNPLLQTQILKRQTRVFYIIHCFWNKVKCFLHFLKSRHLLSLSLFHKANVFHFLVTVFLIVSFKHVSHNLFPIFSQHYNYYCLIILALPHPLLSESDFKLCSLSETSLSIGQDFLYSRIYLFNISPELTVFKKKLQIYSGSVSLLLLKQKVLVGMWGSLKYPWRLRRLTTCSPVGSIWR